MNTEIGNDFRKGLKQRESKKKPCNRKCHPNAESKNDEGVLSIISGLKGVIPTVKHLKDWADQADQQDHGGNDVRPSGSHWSEV